MPKISQRPAIGPTKDKKRKQKLRSLLTHQPKSATVINEDRRLALVAELRSMSQELQDLGQKLHGILSELTDVLVPQEECPF